MSALSEPSPARRRNGVAGVLLVLTGATVLYLFPPETPIYPACPLHTLTGWHCPGCGATRCLHALVHGELRQAFAYNPLLVALLPLLAFAFVQANYPAWTGRRWPLPSLPGWLWPAVLWTALVFGLLRNLDVYPLTLLAPHEL